MAIVRVWFTFGSRQISDCGYPVAESFNEYWKAKQKRIVKRLGLSPFDQGTAEKRLVYWMH